MEAIQREKEWLFGRPQAETTSEAGKLSSLSQSRGGGAVAVYAIANSEQTKPRA